MQEDRTEWEQGLLTHEQSRQLGVLDISKFVEKMVFFYSVCVCVRVGGLLSNPKILPPGG